MQKHALNVKRSYEVNFKRKSTMEFKPSSYKQRTVIATKAYMINLDKILDLVYVHQPYLGLFHKNLGRNLLSFPILHVNWLHYVMQPI